MTQKTRDNAMTLMREKTRELSKEKTREKTRAETRENAEEKTRDATCSTLIYIYTTLHMDAGMTQKMTRAEKQMAKLLKKLRKDVMLLAGKKERWVDDTVLGNPDTTADLMALEMFREMKRREF